MFYPRFFFKRATASAIYRNSHTHSYSHPHDPLVDTIYFARCIDNAFERLYDNPTPKCYKCQHFSVTINYNNNTKSFYNVSCRLHNMHPTKARLDFNKCGPEGRHFTHVR